METRFVDVVVHSDGSCSCKPQSCAKRKRKVRRSYHLKSCFSILILIALSLTLIWFVAKRCSISEDSIDVSHAGTELVMLSSSRDSHFGSASSTLDHKIVKVTPGANEEVPQEESPVQSNIPTYTQDDLECLAVVIYQEAGGDALSDEFRYYVGCVVMNRVESNLFPNTVREVAEQYRQWGRLYWTGVVWPDRANNPEEAHAVARAYDIAKKVLEDTERSVPSNVVWFAEFKQGDGVWLESDGMYFCYSNN